MSPRSCSIGKRLKRDDNAESGLTRSLESSDIRHVDIRGVADDPRDALFHALFQLQREPNAADCLRQARTERMRQSSHRLIVLEYVAP